ncbi:acyltransferase family protein [Actinomycetospora aeridis]|uniref:Acyltransferase n=1 Tax=Actinomycetospora aeridis TaxID=3129231 RepID=A0ABU8N6B2_9PSEU
MSGAQAGAQQAPAAAVPAPPPVLHAMTGLRAVAAAWVLLGHFRFTMFDLVPITRIAEPVLAGGYLGVEIFFVLSGFIISHNYAEHFRQKGRSAYPAFLWARFARIYPVHLATFLAAGLLVAGAVALGRDVPSAQHFTAGSFVGNLVLLQAWPGVTPWNGPAWSVSCEIAAYAAFPLLALAVVRLHRRTALAAGAALLAAEVATLLALGAGPSYTDAWTPVL